MLESDEVWRNSASTLDFARCPTPRVLRAVYLYILSFGGAWRERRDLNSDRRFRESFGESLSDAVLDINN